MWKDIHYATAGSAANFFAFKTPVRNLGNWSYPGGNGTVWRSASSEYNAAGQSAFYYKGASCTGLGFSSVRPSGDSDFTNGSPPGDFQDAIESSALATQLNTCLH